MTTSATTTTTTTTPAPKATVLARMTHGFAATTQAGLSYFFLIGFFGAIYLVGRGVLTGINPTSDLKEVLMLIMYFWFQRTRDTTASAPAAGTLTAHQVTTTTQPTPGVPPNVQPALVEPLQPAPAVAAARPASAAPSAPGVAPRPAV